MLRQPNKHTNNAFTIVELLIVIVVIGILAAITIVAYNGLQQRARDSQRHSDVSNLVKALELYYIDNARYPLSSGSTAIGTGWSTTADSSWQNLVTQLQPYVNTIPVDPVSTPGIAVTNSSSVGYNYAYYSRGAYCGVAGQQSYIIVYRYEGKSQENTLLGNCTTPVLGPYSGASNYRQVKS